jgi:hypothetical protein
MDDRNAVIRYLLNHRFESDPVKGSKASKFSAQHIRGWCEGKNTPQVSNVDRFIHAATAIEFRVIVEYAEIDFPSDKHGLRTYLSELLSDHKDASGLYAYYDSMAQLIYLGKSDGNLLTEAYQQLNAKITQNIFPKGATQPKKRRDVVRYFSAYEVRGLDVADNARHVESLILRISKPRLNKNIGKLQPAVR